MIKDNDGDDDVLFCSVNFTCWRFMGNENNNGQFLKNLFKHGCIRKNLSKNILSLIYYMYIYKTTNSLKAQCIY